jgi:hypothetical protein
MPKSLIQAAIEPRHGRDQEQQRTTWPQRGMSLIQEHCILGDMLEHIHRYDRVGGRWGSDTLEVAVYDPHTGFSGKPPLQEWHQIIAWLK